MSNERRRSVKNQGLPIGDSYFNLEQIFDSFLIISWDGSLSRVKKVSTNLPTVSQKKLIFKNCTRRISITMSCSATNDHVVSKNDEKWLDFEMTHTYFQVQNII